ncbi:unnamed protein product [Gadus morhua 'NCC']
MAVMLLCLVHVLSHPLLPAGPTSWGRASSAAVVFPMMVLALVFIRKLLDFFFTKRELSWLDDLIPESKKDCSRGLCCDV